MASDPIGCQQATRRRSYVNRWGIGVGGYSSWSAVALAKTEGSAYISYGDVEPDRCSSGRGRRDRERRSQSLGAMPHAHDALAGAVSRRVEAFAVVGHGQNEPRVLLLQVDLDERALGMAGGVVHGFLEHEQEIAAHVHAQLHGVWCVRDVESQLDLSEREHFLGVLPHPSRQVEQALTVRIDGPDDVAHRADRLARDARNGRQRSVVPASAATSLSSAMRVRLAPMSS